MSVSYTHLDVYKRQQQYIDSYDAANPTAPMEYDYTTLKESIPWMEILFYLGCLLYTSRGV